MEKHYEERFQAQLRLDEKIAPLMEINDILEKMRAELRVVIGGRVIGGTSLNTDFHSRDKRQNNTLIKRSRLSPRFYRKAMEL